LQRGRRSKRVGVGQQTIVIDDMAGHDGGIVLSSDIQSRLTSAGLGVEAPSRGGKAGDVRKPGTLQTNATQQDYFLGAATKVVLPLFKQRARPFMLVFWSQDPDGTHHNQGDSLNRLVPGINGPTSLAAIRNADHDLAELLAALKSLGLDQTTDVIVTADHGFSTITKESATSFAATQAYDDVLPNHLPVGFVALDLAHGLGLPLIDPDTKYAEIPADAHPATGDALIGGDKDHPIIVVAANGGSDLVYVPNGDRNIARRAVEVLSAQDYVRGLFVSNDLGPIPGALPISAIDLKGSAVTPLPSIVVNFHSFSTGRADPLTCGVEVADTALQQGQGMHGSFSRADTAIVAGALGPDFRMGFIDPAPSSNADIGKTIAHILNLNIPDVGNLVGRALLEATRKAQWWNGPRRPRPPTAMLVARGQSWRRRLSAMFVTSTPPDILAARSVCLSWRTPERLTKHPQTGRDYAQNWVPHALLGPPPQLPLGIDGAGYARPTFRRGMESPFYAL
jgi:Type I phosphodiesterase / nucleotide pyrophosphatase